MNEQIRKHNSSTKEENQSKKMGTREVYDYQQQKWIPYVSDPDKWYQHFIINNVIITNNVFRG